MQYGWPGIGNISSDPLCIDADGPDDLAGTADDDLRLLPGSPCIDAADNTVDTDAQSAGVQALPEADLDGHARFVDDPATADSGVGAPPIVDMGPHEYRPGDLDHDGDVDLDDHAALAECLSGPDATPPPDCAEEVALQADLDGDGDVDLGDFAVFQLAFTPE